MRGIKDDEVEEMDCKICLDYRGKTVRTKGYAFTLNVCKHYEGCPYAVKNEDKNGVKGE